MSQPLYRQAFAEAWHLVWHNKIIWILGLLSALVGQFGLSGFFGKALLWGEQLTRPGVKVFWSCQWLDGWGGLDWWGKVGMVWAGGILLALAAAVVFVAVSSQGALFAAAADWFSRKRADKLSAAWHQGVRRFWPLLALNFLQKLLLVILFTALILGWGYGVDWDRAGGRLLAGFFLTLSLLAAFVVTTVFVFSVGFVAVDNEGVWPAIIKGWRLLKNHLLVSVEASLLLFLASLMLVALITIASVAVLLPSVVIWLIGGFIGSSVVLWWGFFVGLLLFAIFVVFSGAIFNAFASSVWVYLFIKMKREGIGSHLLRWLEKIFRRN